MSIFKQGKNVVNKQGNVTVCVTHMDGEPYIIAKADRGFMDLTDVEVLRDMLTELLEANESHTEEIPPEPSDYLEQAAKMLADENKVEEAWFLRGISDVWEGEREDAGEYQRQYRHGRVSTWALDGLD